MTIIKERIIGAITIMSEKEAERVWAIIQKEFGKKNTAWDDIEEVEPTEEEKKIIAAYESGDERYQPCISHKDLKKELGLE